MARRILVVDDDPTIRSSFTEVLADEETEVRTAASAEEALAAIDAQRPDLV
jgi:CheY-like chemotaxis protein